MGEPTVRQIALASRPKGRLIRDFTRAVLEAEGSENTPANARRVWVTIDELKAEDLGIGGHTDWLRDYTSAKAPVIAREPAVCPPPAAGSTSIDSPPPQLRLRGDLTSRNSTKRAPGALPPLGSSGGDRGAPGPTLERALPYHRKTDLSADGDAKMGNNAPSFIQGGSAEGR